MVLQTQSRLDTDKPSATSFARAARLGHDSFMRLELVARTFKQPSSGIGSDTLISSPRGRREQLLRPSRRDETKASVLEWIFRTNSFSLRARRFERTSGSVPKLNGFPESFAYRDRRWSAPRAQRACDPTVRVELGPALATE